MTTSKDFNSKSSLNPRFILYQKQTKNDILLKSSFQARLTDSVLGKKYYGKKILKITKQAGLTRALTLRKLFTRIELYSDSIEGAAFRSRGNKIIFYEDVPITKFQLKKIFLTLKGTIDYDDFSSFFDKQIFQMTRLYMRGVQQLSFIWNDKNEIKFDTKTFASLRSLEKLTISVQCSSDSFNSFSATSDICDNLQKRLPRKIFHKGLTA